MEANKLSVADGRQVVHGRSLTADEWVQARRAGALPPAGQVTPSPKPFHPDGAQLAFLEREKWTDGIQQIVSYASWFGRELIERMVTVQIANDSGWPFHAAYGDGVLYLNIARLGYKWFEEGASVDVNRLLIHEFGHEYCGDHLSSDYHKALTRLGAKAIALALERPDAFSFAQVGVRS